MSFTSHRVRMLSLSARTLLASLSATRLSASRLLMGKERFNRSNCWWYSLNARSVGLPMPLISSERIIASIAAATKFDAAFDSDIRIRMRVRPLALLRAR
eukprot:3288511-Pleurochrysis_carterae.AAC.1